MELDYKEENVEKDADKKSKEQAQRNDHSKEIDDAETAPMLMSVSVCEEINDVETTPNLMSVAIGGYIPAQTFRKAAQTFPKERMSVAVGGYNPAQTLQKERITSQSQLNYLEQSIQRLWEIGKIDIPVVSSDYRRSRTVLDISKNAEIAKIIFASNKTRSIHAVYDGATVKCKTSSYLKFTVRLLLPAQNAENVMVDVRRVSGCAMAFRDEYQALQAVLSIKTPSSFQHTSLPDFDFMKDNYIPLEEGVIERSIGHSEKNIESKMYDTRIITLQDLLLTTDPDSKETSLTACRLIVEKYSKILEYVVTDMMKGNGGGDSDDDSQEYLRSLSLNLLSNLLVTESGNQTLHNKVEEHRWGRTLIESLVLYVREARDHPWNACLASKCLCLLARTFNMYQGNIDVHSALENAEQYGHISHMQLEKEAQAALSELGIIS